MLVVRRLRHDARRYGAMGATVLVAVTAFVVLTGSAQSSRLTTTTATDAAFRPAYDILVRPPLLFLVAAVAYVAISATSVVRADRRQLGVLSCLGWRPWTIVRAVLVDLVAVGAVAGLVGAAVAVPVALLLDAEVVWWHAIAAIPGAVVVALAGGVVPALTAARALPVDGLRPAVRAPRRPTRLRGSVSLARSFVRRTPGRAAVVALTLAFAVSSFTVLAGGAASVRAYDVDVASGVLVAVLALGGLADILYLDLHEQAASYASLQAAGWRDRAVGALIVQQAVIIGLLGALVGAAAGLATLSQLTTLDAAVWWTTGLITAVAIALCALVAVLPALALLRLPTAALLAEE